MNVDLTFLIPTLAVVLWIVYRAWRAGRAAEGPADKIPLGRPVEIDPTPDTPVPFGYKMSWLAVRASTSESVAEVAGIPDLQPANWHTGILAAYNGSTFLSPPIAGWVLVVSYHLPDPGERREEWNRLLLPLAAQFRQVCYFGTHRVVSYTAWARFVDGRLVRALAYLGERGEIFVNEGAPSDEELSLNHQFSSLPVGPLDSEDPEADFPPTPEEDDVLDMAAAWTVSPRDLPDLALAPSRGWVSRSWLVA